MDKLIGNIYPNPKKTKEELLAISRRAREKRAAYARARRAAQKAAREAAALPPVPSKE